MTADPIPLFAPDFGPEEEAEVLACLRSGWVAAGPRVEELEKRFAAAHGFAGAVAVSSATAALHLATAVAGIGPGDEVIVPSLTFAATANCVRYVGATPVFADVASEQDWTLDVRDVERRIGPRTRAVIVMHYAGFPCDMAAFEALCRQRKILLIEDACHGLGGSIDGRPMGGIGDITTFSFYANKAMTTGEGGMFLARDAEQLARAKRLRSHGMTASSYDRTRGAMGYDITEIGWNYRLDDLRAALGLAQYARLPSAIARRRELVALYRELLSGVAGLVVPDFGRRGEPANYLFPVAVTRAQRDEVRSALAARGIQTSLHYPPVHEFACYRDLAAELPRTQWIARRALTLPLYPSLGAESVRRVCAALIDVLGSA